MAKQLLSWTQEAIRADNYQFGWMEERKFDWVPLVSNCLGSMLSGSAIIILADTNRDWLAKYIIQSLNKAGNNRPVLPFFEAKSLIPAIGDIKSEAEFESHLEMLGIVVKNFFFWYIGKHDDMYANVAKKREDSFLWLFDESLQNSFYFKSIDPLLDFKLIALTKLFDKTIDAAMFAEVELS